MFFFDRPLPWKKIALGALTITVLILGTVTVMRAAVFKVSRTDLTVYLRAAEAIHHGENIYSVENARHWHYVYLPLLAVLLVPFSGLPLLLNAALWYLLSITALVGTFRILQKLFPKNPKSFGIAFLIFTLGLPPLLNTLARGQMGALSLYLTLLVFLLDQKNKKFLAGFILGFAIILKMSPLLVLPIYFLIHRNRRAVAGCVLGGLFFGFIFPLLVLPPALNHNYILNYLKVLSEASGSLGWKSYLWDELFTPFASDNQSFYAIATRLFWKSESAFRGHSNQLIRNINLGLFLSLLSLFSWLTLRGKRFSTFRFSDFASKKFAFTRHFTEFALLSMLMLFTSPVSQLHHFTPLILLGAAAFLNLEANPEVKKILFISMGTCFVFFSLGMLFEPLAFIGLPFLGSFLLWIAVFLARLKSS